MSGGGKRARLDAACSGMAAASTSTSTRTVATVNLDLAPAAALAAVESSSDGHCPILQLPAELLLSIFRCDFELMEVDVVWPLRGVCRAWRAAIESVPWSVERRVSAELSEEGVYDAPQLVQLAELVRAGKLRPSRLGLTLGCVHKHDWLVGKRVSPGACSSSHAEMRVLMLRSHDVLNACSARGLVLKDAAFVLLYTCALDMETSDLIRLFIQRKLELLGRSPSAATLRQLTIDAVPMRVDDDMDYILKLTADDGDGLATDESDFDDHDPYLGDFDTQSFTQWPVKDVPDNSTPRWRPSAADVQRLLAPFRSLRRLSFAPHAAVVSSPAAAAIAAALPGLQSLRLCPASDESFAALAPLPLRLFHLGAQDRNCSRAGDADAAFPVGEALERLAEGRAGECLESLVLEWSTVSPPGLQVLARMPKLEKLLQILVHPAPGLPEALASLRGSPSLAELHIHLKTYVRVSEPEPSTADEVAAVFRGVAEAAGAPALRELKFSLDTCPSDPGSVAALIEAIRGPLSQLRITMVDRGLAEREIAAVVDASQHRLRDVSIVCVAETYADINHLKLLRGRHERCSLDVRVFLSPRRGAFSNIASARGAPKLRRFAQADLQRALPGAKVDVILMPAV